MNRKILTLMLAAGVVAACDDGTGVEGDANLSIAFATTSSTSLSADAGVSASLVPGTSHAITVAGTNGTLVIDEIYAILAEFELDGILAECQNLTEEEEEEAIEECDTFEAPPSLIQIPTDGTPFQVVSGPVSLGTYEELGWEVEDLSLDDEAEDAQEIQAVQNDIEAIFGAGIWPAEASMAVIGTFQADGEDTPTSFTTFFDAEIGVWIPITPPIEITEEGSSRELTVVLSPEVWFTRADGSVMDLAALSGQLTEFEVEFENGVVGVEHDDD